MEECIFQGGMEKEKKGAEALTDVELPSLNMLPGFFACDYNDEFGDFSSGHPFVQL